MNKKQVTVLGVGDITIYRIDAEDIPKRIRAKIHFIR
jgi:hypothetical protein